MSETKGFQNYVCNIWEEVELPSQGMIYDKIIPYKFKIRSMNTLEEMKRLSPTETPYKVMSDIIEECLEPKPEIHVCDMSISDYQYLLHRLRIATYGPEYKMLYTCPNCKQTIESISDLESIKVNKWDDSYLNDMIIKLPVTNDTIKLKFETPHSLDVIAYKNKEMRKRTKIPIDYSLMFTLESLIASVNGMEIASSDLQDYIKELPLKDVNYILNKSKELNDKVGLDTEIEITCAQCGEKAKTTFRNSSEFFGPTIY